MVFAVYIWKRRGEGERERGEERRTYTTTSAGAWTGMADGVVADRFSLWGFAVC